MPDEYFLGFQAASISEHACGLDSRKRLRCFGNYPPYSAANAQREWGALYLGGRHTCAAPFVPYTLQDPTQVIECFAGSSSLGAPTPGSARDPTWLINFLSQWGPDGFGDNPALALRSVSLLDAAACAIDAEGVSHCLEPSLSPEVKHGPLKVPSPLQPPRLDLIEQGVSLRGLRCGGDAWRNGSQERNGQMFCCALDQNAQVRCWGATPPHANVFNVTGFDNASVFDIRRRRCVGRSRYMREFALRLILDTHPNASLAEAATNHTRPFVCHNVPRRWTQNITTHLIDWIGANFSNITHTYKVRSWQLCVADPAAGGGTPTHRASAWPIWAAAAMGLRIASSRSPPPGVPIAASAIRHAPPVRSPATARRLPRSYVRGEQFERGASATTPAGRRQPGRRCGRCWPRGCAGGSSHPAQTRMWRRCALPPTASPSCSRRRAPTASAPATTR